MCEESWKKKEKKNQKIQSKYFKLSIELVLSLKFSIGFNYRNEIRSKAMETLVFELEILIETLSGAKIFQILWSSKFKQTKKTRHHWYEEEEEIRSETNMPPNWLIRSELDQNSDGKQTNLKVSSKKKILWGNSMKLFFSSDSIVLKLNFLKF